MKQMLEQAMLRKHTSKYRSAVYADDEPRAPRSSYRFSIGPNSHPRKVMRWLKRFGTCVATAPETLAKHIHPRHKRAA